MAERNHDDQSRHHIEDGPSFDTLKHYSLRFSTPTPEMKAALKNQTFYTAAQTTAPPSSGL